MLSITQTEKPDVKSLWCRHGCIKRNQSRLLVPQVQPDATFTLFCHSLRSLFYSTSVVTSGLWVPGARRKALSIIRSVTWALSPESALPIRSNASIWGLSVSQPTAQLWNQTYFCEAVLICDSSFCSPCLQSKRTKSRMSCREHSGLLDDSVSPEDISAGKMPAVREKLDLFFSYSSCLPAVSTKTAMTYVLGIYKNQPPIYAVNRSSTFYIWKLKSSSCQK